MTRPPFRYAPMVHSLLKQRDGSVCALCNRLIENGEESVDHILQRVLGGSHEASNLRLVHLKCNMHRPRKEKADDVTAVTDTPVSVRKRLFSLLARLHSPQRLSFNSVALGMGTHPSLLSRYLRVARNAGWVTTKKSMGDGLVITVLDRAGLEKASSPVIDR